MRTGFLFDPLYANHLTGPGHPERPERLDAILGESRDLDLIRIPARDATFEELHTVHEEGYPARIRDRIKAGESMLDADTAVSAGSFRAAIRAAGGALALGEAFHAGRVEAGFACLRPPGHHACRDRAMGFCLFNNAALLARALSENNHRVCIVDFDVHHGNGTQDIFEDDPEVGYCSLHEHPLYPGTGSETETGAGNLLNIPLPAGSGIETYRAAFEKRVLPWIEGRAPDVIVLSAGFDAHELDPLARMRLATNDYATLTRMLATRPVLSLLEGGYDLEALGGSVQAHLQALIEA